MAENEVVIKVREEVGTVVRSASELEGLYRRYKRATGELIFDFSGVRYVAVSAAKRLVEIQKKDDKVHVRGLTSLDVKRVFMDLWGRKNVGGAPRRPRDRYGLDRSRGRKRRW